MKFRNWGQNDQNTPNNKTMALKLGFLKRYFDKFETLEGLIDDLRSLEFDFKSSCERYINKQFTKEELEEFTYSEY